MHFRPWLVLLSLLWVAPVSGQGIVLASDTWHNLTRADGTGLYFDLIRAVYEPAGVPVTFRIVPYSRSVSLVKAQQVDGWVASFRQEQPFPLYPEWAFDRNRQVAVALKGGPATYQGIESLKGRRVVWLRDFNLDRYVMVPLTFQEIDELESAFPMLLAGRADFFIGAESDIVSTMKSAQVDPSRFSLTFVMNLDLTIAFADTDRGRKYRDLWDQRMKTLHRDPAFLQIYRRYGYPVPFD